MAVTNVIKVQDRTGVEVQRAKPRITEEVSAEIVARLINDFRTLLRYGATTQLSENISQDLGTLCCYLNVSSAAVFSKAAEEEVFQARFAGSH